MVSFDEAAEYSYGEEPLALAERLADPGASRPDARMCAGEDRRTLAQCIGRLPKTQATVIVLHYLQNVPLREVAQLLEVTPSRVSQLHRRGLERLQQVWGVAMQAA
jgi:RNA polymerase sigma factor (sigma-70 family)